MALLHNIVKFLEERRANNMIERGNRIFKDQQTVDAFILLTGDKDLYRYCFDFVILLDLAPEFSLFLKV